jgi:hypothetical protein
MFKVISLLLRKNTVKLISKSLIDSILLWEANHQLLYSTLLEIFLQ